MEYQRTTGPSPDSSRNDAGVTWGLKEIGIAIILFLACYLIVSLSIALPAVAAFGSDSAEARFAEVLAILIVDAFMGGIVIMLARRSGAGLADLGLRLPLPRRIDVLSGSRPGPAWGRTAGVIVLGLIAAYASFGVYNVIVDALGIDALKPAEQVPEAYFNNASVVVVLGIGVVVMAPLVEELFFRGFVFGGMRKLTGLVPAAIIAGLLFGCAHFQLGLIIPFGVIGIIFATAYYATGSLIPSMTMHFLFNLLSFLVLVFDPGAR